MRNFLTRFVFIFILIQIIGEAKVCYASEKSEVDPLKKHMSLKTQNLTFGHHISVDETLHYTPHPSDPSKTLLKQEATVKVHGIPLSYYMENMLTSNISANANKGRQGLEWVISKINTEVRAIKFAHLQLVLICLNKNAHILFSPFLKIFQVKEIADAVSKSTDDILHQTHKSIDDMTETARKSMDEMSTAAKQKWNL